ncbi:hypothetical protein KL929_003738 [Ogataea haglerorum]|nr:hypothetical protein KL929_003738 [Ogataea haglerorum]
MEVHDPVQQTVGAQSKGNGYKDAGEEVLWRFPAVAAQKQSRVAQKLSGRLCVDSGAEDPRRLDHREIRAVAGRPLVKVASGELVEHRTAQKMADVRDQQAAQQLVVDVCGRDQRKQAPPQRAKHVLVLEGGPIGGQLEEINGVPGDELRSHVRDKPLHRLGQFGIVGAVVCQEDVCGRVEWRGSKIHYEQLRELEQHKREEHKLENKK